MPVTVWLMFDARYLFFSLWDWLIQHGLPLSALLIAAILIPRVGRQVVRILSNRMEEGQEETKGKLALVGALVYTLEIVAYFVIVLLALTNLGVPAMGAAIPATVVSAAIGFGSQNIIGDFLSGFFIISERHYGVGDIVTFDDTSSQITGVVVKLTLRSTQIRTDPAAELVTIPNSMASVTINYSKTQSRAVVDLDIPLTGDESMAMLTKTVEDAANEVVTSDAVKDAIRGDVQVQPARSLTAPTAAGLPWTVLMRVGVDTAPANQWLVERAIRANLVNTFWSRFQSPGKVLTTGTELDVLAGGAARSSETKSTDTRGDDGSDTHKMIAAAAENSYLSDLADKADKTDLTGDADDPDSIDTEVIGTPDDAADDAATQVLPPADSTAEAKAEQHGPAGKEHEDSWADGPYESKTKNVLSFGGRFRPSTAGLFIALIVVGLLALFSSSPENAQPGWLSPDRWRDGGPAVESTEDGEDTGDVEAPQDPGPQNNTGTTDGTQDTGGTGNTGEPGTTPDSTGDTGQGQGQGQDGQNNPGGTGNTGNSPGEPTGGTEQNQGQAPPQQAPATGDDTGSGETTAP